MTRSGQYAEISRVCTVKSMEMRASYHAYARLPTKRGKKTAEMHYDECSCVRYARALDWTRVLLIDSFSSRLQSLVYVCRKYCARLAVLVVYNTCSSNYQQKGGWYSESLGGGGRREWKRKMTPPRGARLSIPERGAEKRLKKKRRVGEKER